VLLSVVAYLCFGMAYQLWADGTPSEFLDGGVEEFPEIDAANMSTPGFLRVVVAFVWVVSLLMWPYFLARDCGDWLADGARWVWRKVRRAKEKEGDK
jgi:hypothetical protein